MPTTNPAPFTFDYTKYRQGVLTVGHIDALLDRLISFKVPSVPIPYAGPWIELAMLALQISGIVALLAMRKQQIDLELMVAKQIYEQSLHIQHDGDVIN
jgi:hypothetical protein